MNEEQQRIAIAEACGWHDCGISDGTPYGLRLGITSLKGKYEPLPDYLNDLNAISDAIAKLPANLHITFGFQLHGLLNLSLVGYVSNYPNDYKQLVTIATSPVSILAEAYLKTIGKWEDIKGTLV